MQYGWLGEEEGPRGVSKIDPSPLSAATSARSYSDTGITVSASLNEANCAVYCVIMPSPSTTPTAANVFAMRGAQVRSG